MDLYIKSQNKKRLLKMVKEGKQPNAIKYNGYILSWDNGDKDYYYEEYDSLFTYLFTNKQTTLALEEKVELPEEDKRIPQKIKWKPKESMAGELTQKEQIEVIARRTEKLKKEFNNLLDYLKSKGE